MRRLLTPIWLILCISAALIWTGVGSSPAVADGPPNAETTTDEVGGSSTGESGPEDELTVTYLDVGQADATLIQKGDIDILVDAGRHYSASLQEAMETITDSVDLMIITHPHADHYGGVADLLGEHQVDRIVTNGERRGPPRDGDVPVTWREFVDAVDTADLELDNWSQGDTIDVTDHLSMDVLASGGDFDNTSDGTDINNDSLVLSVEFLERRILLTGDIEVAGGRQLVRDHCRNGPDDCPGLDTDIFQVPHHGSHHFHPPFFEAADPDWAVFGSPYDNRQHHHPRIETLSALLDLDARIKSTNKDGGTDVAARIDTEGRISWTVDNPEIFVWRTDTDPETGKVCRVDTNADGTNAACHRHTED